MHVSISWCPPPPSYAETSLAGPLLASDFPNPPSSILCIPSMQSNRKLYIVHTRQRTLVDRATKHLECACNQHIRLALTIIHICMYEYGYSISAACPLSQTRPICLHTFSGQQRCHAIICTCHAIVPNWSWCRTMYRSGALGESLPYYRTSIAQFKIADQICLVC